jgi:hypothetical protein
MIDWKFPPNADGEDDDLNNPGVESFKNSPLTSLAREICQNSLDAKNKNSSAPVEVHFNTTELTSTNFPGYDELQLILQRCKAYRPDSKRFQQFFDKAISVLSSKTITCMLIADYQTTGLTGAGGDKGTDWYKLTRTVGSSDKAGGLGSFGIGKFAPFANSDLRTVFYSTLNLEKQHAFQGLARLVTHEFNGSPTRGTGYYGITDKNGPVLDRAHIPKELVRKEPGTNILVAGFKKSSNWEEEITCAVVDSFFVAVMNDALVVKAGGTLINRASLPGIIESLKARSLISNTSAYFDALISSDSKEFINTDFEGLGQISLRILVGKHLPKKVAMVRGSGMKIFDKGHFLTPLRFAGVFTTNGEKIDVYLKSLEPPQHDSFEHERGDNPSEAKIRLNKLYSWIRDCVRSIANDEQSEEVEIEGMSRYLPDDVDDSPRKNTEPNPDEKSEAANEIQFVVKTRDSYRKKAAITTEDIVAGEEDPAEFPGNNENENGTSSKNTGTNKVDGNDGDGSEEGKKTSDGQPTSMGAQPVSLRSQRVFSADSASGVYVVTFEPDSDGVGHLTLNAVGEVGQEAIAITNARFVDTGASIPVISIGCIGPITFAAGIRNRIEVKLKQNIRCALGVSLNAN